MYAGVTGLRSHQSKMDVIGNNIANVNTWSFKSYATHMTDASYTTNSPSTGGQAINGGYGGINPNQLGYGSRVSSVTPDLNKGAPAPSSNTLDNMIDGMGYYITGTLKKGGVPVKDRATNPADKTAGLSYLINTDKTANPDGIDNTAFEYSRVGIFSIDDNGYLVDNQGRYIYGFRAHQQVNVPGGGKDPEKATFRDGQAENGAGDKCKYLDDGATAYAHTALNGRLEALCVPIKPGTNPERQYDIVGYKLDANGTVTGIEKGTGAEITIGRIALTTFENPQGLQKTAGSYWSYSNNGNAGDAVIGKTTETTGGRLLVGYLEMSNADVAKEFTEMITTQRGYQANSKIITVTDEMLEVLVNMKR